MKLFTTLLISLISLSPVYCYNEGYWGDFFCKEEVEEKEVFRCLWPYLSYEFRVTMETIMRCAGLYNVYDYLEVVCNPRTFKNIALKVQDCQQWYTPMTKSPGEDGDAESCGLFGSVHETPYGFRIE
ncbi:uncharacterized protein LOC111632525 isoform X1 [Centruroides sculpturatus]|uniref:uncharacterized protein LOC111632525 isoform X1 n=1 Tax=Centruroides sculpturatus TaxID=218467 RepID=UPI000C6D6096|nr:uncharacterized protein LOC111632525 isoform X1 [Centruroides sculpturatus]